MVYLLKNLIALHKIYFSYIYVSHSLEKYNFMYSYKYATFCIELYCDLKLCFESSIKYFRLAYILHIEFRKFLVPKDTLNTNPQGPKMIWVPKNKT